MEVFKYCYYFDEDTFEIKLKLRNGTKFKFLDNYYEYYFNNSDKEQILTCHCILNDYKEAVESIKYSNQVLEYIFSALLIDNDQSIYEEYNKNNIAFKKINISTSNADKLKFVSESISRFNVEKKLFNDVIKLHHIAIKNLTTLRNEDALLYYFKIIEKIAKKNYIKYYERNYTKQVKKNNKKILNKFIKEYFEKNFKVTVTDNMLNTMGNEIYRVFKEKAYSSIFLKIVFFCNLKRIRGGIMIR